MTFNEEVESAFHDYSYGLITFEELKARIIRLDLGRSS
jgi:hypothetical protein